MRGRVLRFRAYDQCSVTKNRHMKEQFDAVERRISAFEADAECVQSFL